ncbi:MAG: DUF1579 domain-containing protein [Myxococcales bacterium]|nr:DUF1579 domain-containing protein [Myxococcales bacterium]
MVTDLPPNQANAAVSVPATGVPDNSFCPIILVTSRERRTTIPATWVSRITTIYLDRRKPESTHSLLLIPPPRLLKKGSNMPVKTITLSVMCLLPATAAAQDFPTPSEEHKIIMQDVGEWSFQGSMQTPEGKKEFKGEEKVVAIGEFWTVSHYSSGGLKGSATIGFDPKTEQFVGTWVDSFQPTATRMRGTFDKKSKKMTYKTIGVGMDGKPMPGKIVVHYKDKDTHHFTVMLKDPTGQTDKLVTTMEMVYTRKTSTKSSK